MSSSKIVAKKESKQTTHLKQVLVRSLQTTSLTCLLEPWLRELGFSIFYGSILIKLYRILAEFQTRKAHRVCLRDKDQIVYLLAILLIVVGYMSAWTALMVDGFFVSGSGTGGGSAAGASLASESDRHQQQSSPAEVDSRALSGQDKTTLAPVRLERSHQQASNFIVNSQDWPAAAASPTNSTSSPLSPSLLRQQHTRPKRNPISNTYQLSVLEAANDQLELLARGLNSFGQLFLGLLETGHYFDAKHDELVYFVRCRKLTWDYVTESSECLCGRGSCRARAVRRLSAGSSSNKPMSLL